jgi:hypothetical protein
MGLRKSWCVALALVAGLSTAGWTRSSEARNQNPSAAAANGKIPIGLLG